ncbi:hypothetical protein RGQ13_17640 [Thalassotalea psychrophila]|uniref:Porin n=1 Tax=Thalassotalea psychrophila TaxID=3065647 RepID=A0ABY9TSW3_9GAMM|nr:hypothetical protein RGQ13_17640 [Colwelliaceae bacterium SQ149]
MANIFRFSIATSLLLVSTASFSETETDEDVQDMSDPTAVYTQGGVGVTNKGLNFKYGESYDTGSPTKMGMNVLEIMGVAGETLGWDSNHAKDNSIDSFRFRNFELNTVNGRGTQIDMTYNVDSETGSAGYNLMQALPKMGMFQFFPLAGAGVAFGNNVLEDDGTTDSGYSVMGTYATVGMYSKITLTDKIWLNYNPFYSKTLSGSDNYKDFGMEGDDAVLTHEFAASYQMTPRMNIRYFANWTENVDISDGNHRVEVNYQF